MGRKTNKSNGKKSKTKAANNSKENLMDSNSWVNRLRFVSIENRVNDEKVDLQATSGVTLPTTISILSWNVLAEAYCSRYSQVKLPTQFQKVVFNSAKRKARILEVLEQLCSDEWLDVICLQEVDMPEIRDKMISLGYLDFVETPRTVGGGAGGRTDGCALYVRNCSDFQKPSQCRDYATNKVDRCSSDDIGSVGGKTLSPMHWQMVDSDIVRLDDLATLSSTTSSTIDLSQMETLKESATDKLKSSCSNIQGIQTSFLRRNMALIVRLRNVLTQETIIIANAHLYWNPGFEYVKLCQCHYILRRVQSFQSSANEPVILCGDLNSRPGGVTHSYLSNGFINAKLVAPWYSGSPHNDETPLTGTSQPTTSDDKYTQMDSADGCDSQNMIVCGFKSIQINQQESIPKEMDDIPKVRYLLDASLNKLCRWLRILGQDVALETDKEEKRRTGEGEMVIFDRCIKERRTLVTTSPRLMQRRDCPPNVYCIHPPFLSHLEVAMVHMLLVHGVVLDPSTFLSRCVVCNGNIVEEHDDITKRQILSEYEAPHTLIDDGMAVYVCDGCQQGYWWNDRPKSSASRVKTAATRLLELCVRGGVPVRQHDEEANGMFDHVNYEELRNEGWNYNTPGSELLQQQLDVVEWLRNEKLVCPFSLESAYLLKRNNEDVSRFEEILPFTNVTHSFIDTLDYIFFEKTRFRATERFYVPRTFLEISDGRSNIQNSYLLPSDIWPSDHLAIAVRLELTDTDYISLNDQSTLESKEEIMNLSTRGFPETTSQFDIPLCVPSITQLSHNRRCTCGCVPSIPSLFEMAELRKKKKQSETF